MIKHKKTSAIVSIVMILVLLVTSTIAWFFLSADVEVDYGSTLTVTTGRSLDIKLEDTDLWSGLVKLTAGRGANLLDVTGDGVSLYTPQNLDEGNPINFKNAVPANSDGYEDGSVSGDYLEYTFDFRSATELDVFLSKESFIKPSNDSDQSLNLYGDFSRGYISGAARVSITEVTVDEEGNETEVLKLVWAPNPEVELQTNGKGKYELKPTGGAYEDYYYYVTSDNSTYTKHYVTPEQYASKQFVTGNTGADELNAVSSPVLTRLKKSTDGSDEFYVAKLRMRIWFEGCDREASIALSGGTVEMNFKFTGMCKTANPRQSDINAITYTNGSYNIQNIGNDMLYSVDGYTWTKFSAITELPKPDDLAEGQTKVFFKAAETDQYYETTCKAVEIK